MVDKVRLGWSMLPLVLYSSSGGQVGLVWWMLMLVLYSSSEGHGKVGMVDASVSAV